MYRLMLLADDGEKQTMVTVGGERELFFKELSDFFNNNATITRIHSRSEKNGRSYFCWADGKVRRRTGGATMKKAYIIAGVAAILVAVMIAFPPTAEPATEKIVVPERVYCGDTLSAVCSRAAIEHGDVRNDLRAIVYDTRLHNNLPADDLIQPGDIILVELEVPADALGRR